ncbi:hypothetical protein O3M35_003655 [Rhynocoris fuscipes]|uniref:Uncharacterized protein n=1 Tax=Rhynocoris fuscipes TaxID=488301 RepID=A0AAW1CNP8_9HEMI
MMNVKGKVIEDEDGRDEAKKRIVPERSVLARTYDWERRSTLLEDNEDEAEEDVNCGCTPRYCNACSAESAVKSRLSWINLLHAIPIVFLFIGVQNYIVNSVNYCETDSKSDYTSWISQPLYSFIEIFFDINSNE